MDNIINNFQSVNEKQVNLINVWKEDVTISLGKPSDNIGRYAFISLEKAKEAIKNNDIDVMVTAPINKTTVASMQKDFIGHTEYLEQNFEGTSLMMMISNNMKIAFATSHVALSEVSRILTKEKIQENLKNINSTLMQDFGVRKPKIAVIGLNPHAGENGMLGKEENKVIIPAIHQAKKEDDILAFGPYPADSFFTPKNLKKFDVA